MHTHTHTTHMKEKPPVSYETNCSKDERLKLKDSAKSCDFKAVTFCKCGKNLFSFL